MASRNLLPAALATVLLAVVLAAPAVQAQLVLTEYMADNGVTLADEDGVYSDWIEVHNPTASPVSLADWYLTDNSSELTKWRFPATNIAANGYLVVFASGNNRKVPGAPLHTVFSLSAGGEYLALVNRPAHGDR